MTQFEIDKERIEKAIETGKRTRLEIELNPEMVDWLFEQRSIRQRNISKVRVGELVRSIERYGWFQCDDFKMASHGLVNGQHRLSALKQLLKDADAKPCFITGLVVNVSEMETQLFDTGLSRTRAQRLKMMTGNEPNHSLISAVVFELAYPDIARSRKIQDKDVLCAIESSSWKQFCVTFPVGTALPNYIKVVGIPAPIYVAIKQMWERCTPEIWSRFREEFQGPGAGRFIQQLRELISGGFRAFKTSGCEARVEQYREAVSYLNAFANGCIAMPKKHRYEWTGVLAEKREM